jgi:phosphoserine phosphatase RsbU/P
LQAFGQQVVIAVENARLVRESIIKERLEQELKVAHDAQMKLLPKEMPQLPGFDIDAVCITANEVGGDYFDFFPLGKTKLGIVIGDVSGKGASAAFYMAEIKGIIGALARGNKSPKQVLVDANKTLFETVDKRIFITAIYGIIDTRDNSFTFCRAGHCPVHFATEASDESQVLEPKGLGLGLTGSDIFEKSLQVSKIKLKKGSRFLLFTDGVNESRNIHDEEFGEKRLLDSFVNMDGLDAKTIKENLLREINVFSGQKKLHDDYSLIVIKAV